MLPRRSLPIPQLAWEIQFAHWATRRHFRCTLSSLSFAPNFSPTSIRNAVHSEKIRGVRSEEAGYERRAGAVLGLWNLHRPGRRGGDFRPQCGELGDGPGRHVFLPGGHLSLALGAKLGGVAGSGLRGRNHGALSLRDHAALAQRNRITGRPDDALPYLGRSRRRRVAWGFGNHLVSHCTGGSVDGDRSLAWFRDPQVV